MKVALGWSLTTVDGISKPTSSLLLCFCRLADNVDVPDISLGAAAAVESDFGRGILEGLSVKGSWPRLFGVPRNVPLTPDMTAEGMNVCR